MYVPWQIQRDRIRARQNDIERGVRYAYHYADQIRRPTSQIARAARIVSVWLANMRPAASGDPMPSRPSPAPDARTRIEIVVTTEP